MPECIKGRFAPSPTGRMHAGNIYSALAAWLIAKSQGGSIVLRIEDLDKERSKPEFVDAALKDFEALGLFWDEGPYFQHDRTEAYREAFRSLQEEGLVYPCFCTRADLHAASAPHRGERFVYAGTCRDLSDAERRARSAVRAPAFRLKVPRRRISLVDEMQGSFAQHLADECGDFIVRRADGVFAYQLAVVVDDAAQGITSVVRGVDLLDSTPQQIYLQELFGLPHPSYAHVPLVVSEAGRRLSKRDCDASIDVLLERFKTPSGVIGHIAGLAGIAPTCNPTTPEELLADFRLSAYARRMEGVHEILWN